MKGILSPVIEHIVTNTILAIGQKEKLDKTINRYRKMLRNVSGTYSAAEVEFGLADMLITRDDPGDWKEAWRFYNHILQTAPYGYLKGASLIGKAEMSIRSSENKEISQSLVEAESAYKILHKFVGPDDFFTLKSQVVQAELFLKRNQGKDKTRAVNLFNKVIKNKNADGYWKSRALVNTAELAVFKKGREVTEGIKLCRQAQKLLAEERSEDYFAFKALLIEGELKFRRGTKVDRKAAMDLMAKIIYSKGTDLDLKVRAKLDKAEVQRGSKGLNLCTEVLGTPNLDSYLYDKARAIEASLKLELEKKE